MLMLTTHLLPIGHLDLLVESNIADGSQAPGPAELQIEQSVITCAQAG